MFSLKLKGSILCIFIGLFAISCDDSNPTSIVEHTDADGFILENEIGNEIYREFEGAITGSITIGIGDTLELSVHFLNHNGDEIEHEEDEGDEEDDLTISENDPSIAIIEVEHHDSPEEEHGEMVIHVIGVSEGTTSFKLVLMHGDHADYTSINNIPVMVQQ